MVNRQHIYPKGDLREHQISAHCWCKPTCDTELVIHNAADGREFFEEEEREAFKQGLADVAAGEVIGCAQANHAAANNEDGRSCHLSAPTFGTALFSDQPPAIDRAYRFPTRF